MILQNFFKKKIIKNYNKFPSNLQFYFNDENFFNHYYAHSNKHENLISLKVNYHKVFLKRAIESQKIEVMNNSTKFLDTIQNKKLNIIIKQKDFSNLNVKLFKNSLSILIINHTNVLKSEYDIFDKLNKNNLEFQFASIILKKFYNNLFIKF